MTTTRFLNALQGAYAESPIWLSWSDDGGLTWTHPKEISGSHPSCTFQTTGSGTECDEDQFSIPEVGLQRRPVRALPERAERGRLGGRLRPRQPDHGHQVDRRRPDASAPPVPAVQLEDGLSDMPWSVIGRQTVWGHQIRWTSAGNISVNPNNPNDVTVVFADRGTANPNATDACIDEIPGTAPAYDPCNAGPSSNTNVYLSRSTDGGATWTGRQVLDAARRPPVVPLGRPQVRRHAGRRLGRGRPASRRDRAGQRPFVHVLRTSARQADRSGRWRTLDVSVTHWAGQYVPQPAWPTVCGPVGYSDPPVTDAEGKDCNVFHGDYTGLAVDPLGPGARRLDRAEPPRQSPQVDPYTGGPHDGYAQDAMYARR